MAELTAITEKLEEGKLPLDDMIKLYEEGEKLSGYIEKMLEAYDQKLEALTNEGQDESHDD